MNDINIDQNTPNNIDDEDKKIDLELDEKMKMEEEEEKIQNDYSHLPEELELDPKIINRLLFILFFANLFLNIDHGILPAGTNNIKSDLSLSNSKFGTLGSVLYLG